jgi:polar amino acid transport system substrate-binding protein
MFSCSLAACKNDSDTWQRIRESGTIRIGLDPTYPPFELIVQDVVRGIDVDLSNAIAKELDLQVSFTYFGYDGLYDALLTDQVDALISAMVILPERTRDFAYSEVYYDAGQFIVSRSSDPYQRPEEFDGNIIAVELGSEGHILAKQLQRQNSTLTINPYRSVDEVFIALVDHEADAVIVDSVAGRLFASQTPGITVSSEALSSEPYAIVVKRDNVELLDKLNEGLSTLGATGILNRIFDRWLDGAASGNHDE